MKRIITFFTMITVMAVSISGCGKEKEKETNVNTGSTNSSQSYVEEEEYVNCIDMQSMLASIKINDEPMEFPIDITKLKSSISLGAVQQSASKNFYRASLMENDVCLGIVDLYSASTSVNEDGYIHFLEVSEGSPWYLSVSGVTFGATVDEVKAAIGTPIFENGDMSDIYRVYYENCSYEYLSFSFQGGVLKTISIEYLPQEWR